MKCFLSSLCVLLLLTAVMPAPYAKANTATKVAGISLIALSSLGFINVIGSVSYIACLVNDINQKEKQHIKLTTIEEFTRDILRSERKSIITRLVAVAIVSGGLLAGGIKLVRHKTA
jgi:hypothetical protein